MLILIKRHKKLIVFDANETQCVSAYYIGQVSFTNAMSWSLKGLSIMVA